MQWITKSQPIPKKSRTVQFVKTSRMPKESSLSSVQMACLVLPFLGYETMPYRNLYHYAFCHLLLYFLPLITIMLFATYFYAFATYYHAFCNLLLCFLPLKLRFFSHTIYFSPLTILPFIPSIMIFTPINFLIPLTKVFFLLVSLRTIELSKIEEIFECLVAEQSQKL